MNNKILGFGIVFSCFNVLAMELALPVSFGESKFFSQHLNMAMKYGEDKIKEEEIKKDNSIHIIMGKMSELLTNANNDLARMIKDNDLEVRIKDYREVDLDETVQFLLKQINDEAGSFKDAKETLVIVRRILSSIKLQKKYPVFSPAWIGELKSGARIDYMKRNNAYPLDKDAVQEFIALFIYQNLLAPKIEELNTNK